MRANVLSAFAAFAVMGCPVFATSIFVQGTIKSVKEDGTGYAVKGYDHYNAKSYSNQVADINVKISTHCVFILDNQVVNRKVALAIGRHSYAIGSSAGAMLVAALSEEADREIGEVVSVADGKLKLKMAIGADAMDVEIPVDAAAAKEATAQVGKTVRVLPARKQTVLAYSEAALEKHDPASTPVAASGALKGAAEVAEIMVFKDGKAEECKPEVKKPGLLVDVRGFPGHGAPDLMGMGAGSPATIVGYFKRPGVLNAWMVLQAPDAGRTDGIVKAVDGRKVTLSILQADGAKDVTATLDADAVIKLDGKTSTLEQALKPGMQVSVFAPRKQTVEPFKVEHEGTR